ncbi:eIF-2-alpha kinase GCN2 isoform X1 [Aplysia californica]|uniref:non-specific serine/threonine protein kinase n=1 Tax=Aplysia californica TaxID=6500 RepID=A0ABM0ZWH3_APLCA|nr:eIF-2-alpha kinase GCN2 isoform X1 [Aplysia californica]
MSNYQERQDEEFQVLESIFGDDLEDLRKKVAWKVARPLELILSLKPQQSTGGEGQVYAQVDMVIKCPPRYPDVAPNISLCNPKGLSDQLLNDLKTQLNDEAAKHVGEVMVWQLANSVQAFLRKNNRPPPQSFYEQMITNKREQQERNKELERKREEQKVFVFVSKQQRQQIELEVLRQQEALRHETRRRRVDQKTTDTSTPLFAPGVSTFSPSPSPIVPPSPQRGNRPVSPVTPVLPPGTPTKAVNVPLRRRRASTPKRSSEGDEYSLSPCKDHMLGVSTMTFVSNKTDTRTVQRGKCLGHSPRGRTTYAGMDSSTGELVAVAEWVLKWRNFSKRASTQDKGEDKEGASHLKQVLNIEQEFLTLSRLSHSHLVHYLAFRHQYDPGKITVQVLMEFSGGTSLSVYARRKDPLPLSVLRGYISEILDALQYLHKNAVVHRNLRPSSVFIDSGGRVRIGDFGIDKKLCDLYDSVDKARPGVHFYDSQPMVLGRGGQRGDIYQLGLMILTLVLGQPILDVIPEIPTNLPAVLQNFLDKCLLKDERLRWTAAQLREHGLLKEPLPSAPISSSVTQLKNKDNNDDLGVTSEELLDKKEEEFEYLISLVASGQSRLASEFELLKVLGKGGFGDVLKVKNKLDGRFYAIKRIPLNPKSKMFNKKMTREVKLLSRLSHENVVRYYCSWIEVSDDPIHSESSSSYTASTQPPEVPLASKRAPHIVRSIPLTRTPVLKAGVKSANSSFDPVGDVEHLVPRAGDESVEWLTSFDKGVNTLFDSSSDEEDEADVFGLSFLPKGDASDDSIVFDTDEKDSTAESHAQNATSVEPNTPNTQEAEMEPDELTVKILYIQMEYCEKSTLRSCIDSGLSLDMDRVWRLFREIIEGLVHIHGQGMIHRDLKPVNIFLDSQDHVKIGDFGLATTDILVKQGALMDLTLPSPHEVALNLSHSASGEGNLTGKVGTALYVSPEVMEGGGKVRYDQKVDIYSLGIIFFEMCHKSLPTGMERVKILSNLRTPYIILPEDFNGNGLSNQAQLIRWLLNHDPSLRPTSKQLLSSDLLPAPQVHDTELGEILRSTVCNPQSSQHRHMLSVIFGQSVLPVYDFTYDQEIYENMVTQKRALLQQQVETTLTQLLVSHGAVRIPLPMFMPKSSVYQNAEQLVQFMDHRGSLVAVPLDLRVPFARYVGRNNIQSMKRFAIEKVFREKKFYNILYNVHPRELTECDFDIITSSGSLIPDAEVLTVVQEVIDLFPSLQNRKYCVRINHMSVLKAILLHCGIPETTHQRALTLLAETMNNKAKRTAALESELKVKVTEQLSALLDTEGPLGKISSILRCITKTMGQASTLAKSGLHDLEHILSHATSLGLKLEVLVSLGLIYNPQQYSGVVFQVMCDNRKKKRVVREVLAAGGRYDKLIERFVSPLHSTSRPGHGVGVSISFDKLVAVVEEEEQSSQLSPCDVIVCTVGHQMMVKERLAIGRDLWAAGFRTDVLFDKTEDFDELQENCRNKGISHIIILKDGETSAVKVRTLDKERMTEKTVMVHQLVEYLQRKTADRSDPQELACGRDTRFVAKESPSYGYGDSTYNVATTNTNSGATSFNYNIVFLLQDKGAKNSHANSHTYRRRHEALIAGKVSTQFPWLPEKNLEVLALDMPTSCIKTIQAYIELGDQAAFETSIGTIMEKQAKLRKYLVGVCDTIHDLRFKKKCNFILLYSTKEETLQLLT